METAIKKVPTSVRFSSALYSRIQDAAMRDHRSVSNWIEMVIISFLGDEPNETTKAAIEEARSGKLEPIEQLDLTSVESMLKSFGV